MLMMVNMQFSGGKYEKENFILFTQWKGHTNTIYVG